MVSTIDMVMQLMRVNVTYDRWKWCGGLKLRDELWDLFLVVIWFDSENVE
jgi:hypothetical protein